MRFFVDRLQDVPPAVKYREDGYVLESPYYGVIDGVSEPYAGKPREYAPGVSIGMLVRQCIEQNTRELELDLSLDQAVLHLNQRVADLQTSLGLKIAEPWTTGAAGFAFVKLGLERIEIAQAADCFAIWQLTDGSVGITANQVKQFDRSTRQVFERAEQATGSPAAAWQAFAPELERARRANTNRLGAPLAYGVMNGQPELVQFLCYRSFPTRQVQRILLCTDGLFPEVLEVENDLELAKIALEVYERSGLNGLLDRARALENARPDNRCRHAEVTALAINIRPLVSEDTEGLSFIGDICYILVTTS